jgi:hypothetical protein
MATAKFVGFLRDGEVRRVKFHGRLVVLRIEGTAARLDDKHPSMHARMTPMTTTEVSSLHDDPLLDECLW